MKAAGLRTPIALSNSEEPLRVYARVRPVLDGETPGATSVENGLLTVHRQWSTQPATSFDLDGVLSTNASQQDVYTAAAQSIVRSVADGFNGSVIAYGPTGSGKTYTIGANDGAQSSDAADSGSDAGPDDDTSNGIILRAAAELLAMASQQAGEQDDARLYFSAIQEYCDELHDLLAPHDKHLLTPRGKRASFGYAPSSGTHSACKLRLVGDGHGGVELHGVSEVEVTSLESCSKLLCQATSNRAVALTAMNATSSRSHAVFMFKYVRTPKAPRCGAAAAQLPPPHTPTRAPLVPQPLAAPLSAASERSIRRLPMPPSPRLATAPLVQGRSAEGADGTYGISADATGEQPRVALDALLRASWSEGAHACASSSLGGRDAGATAVAAVTLLHGSQPPTPAAGSVSSSRPQTPALQQAQQGRVGRLYLVDLAGSERLDKSRSVGLRATEACHINSTLSVLGRCIQARAAGEACVPFREAKLTRLLQESFGGNAKTALLLCLSDALQHADESLNTLELGARARCVRNRPAVNALAAAAAGPLRSLLAGGGSWASLSGRSVRSSCDSMLGAELELELELAEVKRQRDAAKEELRTCRQALSMLQQRLEEQSLLLPALHSDGSGTGTTRSSAPSSTSGDSAIAGIESRLLGTTANVATAKVPRLRNMPVQILRFNVDLDDDAFPELYVDPGPEHETARDQCTGETAESDLRAHSHGASLPSSMSCSGSGSSGGLRADAAEGLAEGSDAAAAALAAAVEVRAEAAEERAASAEARAAAAEQRAAAAEACAAVAAERAAAADQHAHREAQRVDEVQQALAAAEVRTAAAQAELQATRDLAARMRAEALQTAATSAVQEAHLAREAAGAAAQLAQAESRHEAEAAQLRSAAAAQVASVSAQLAARSAQLEAQQEAAAFLQEDYERLLQELMERQAKDGELRQALSAAEAQCRALELELAAAKQASAGACAESAALQVAGRNSAQQVLCITAALATSQEQLRALKEQDEASRAAATRLQGRVHELDVALVASEEKRHALEATLAEAQRRADEAAGAEKRALDQVSELRSTLAAAEQLGRSLEPHAAGEQRSLERVSDLRSVLATAEERQRALEAKLADQRASLEHTLAEQQRSSLEQVTELRAALATADEQRRTLEGEVSEQRRAAEAKAGGERRMLDQVSELRSAVAAAEEQRRALEQALAEHKASLDAALAGHRASMEQVSELHAQLAVAEEQRRALDQALAQQLATLEAAQAAQRAAREEVAELRSALAAEGQARADGGAEAARARAAAEQAAAEVVVLRLVVAEAQKAAQAAEKQAAAHKLEAAKLRVEAEDLRTAMAAHQARTRTGGMPASASAAAQAHTHLPSTTAAAAAAAAAVSPASPQGLARPAQRPAPLQTPTKPQQQTPPPRPAPPSPPPLTSWLFGGRSRAASASGGPASTSATRSKHLPELVADAEPFSSLWGRWDGSSALRM